MGNYYVLNIDLFLNKTFKMNNAIKLKNRFFKSAVNLHRHQYIFNYFQVFNVILNGAHTVVEELDIFGKVGHGVAHDEIIPFTVKNGRLRYNGESSPIENNKVSIKFAKVKC